MIGTFEGLNSVSAGRASFNEFQAVRIEIRYRAAPEHHVVVQREQEVVEALRAD